MSDHESSDIKYHNIPDFKFTNGTTLHDVKVAYRSINPSSRHGTVLIPTCFSGRIDTTLTFTTPPNDALSKYHVVVVAMLGNGESSSPSNKPFFPLPGEQRYEDVIRSQYYLLTEGLGVRLLEAVVGFSMGGQQAYYWSVLYPDYVKRIVGICTSSRTSGHNYAFLEGPITALSNSIDYVAWSQIKAKKEAGEVIEGALNEVRPTNGLQAFGRAYSAWLTSAEWFREKHWRSLGFKDVESWIQGGAKNKVDWDADDLLVLARMWQMGDIGTVRKEGSLSQLGGVESNEEAWKDALGSIKAKVLLLPCSTDQYFRPAANVEEVEHLKAGKAEVIQSVWGHIAGGGANPDDVAFMSDKINEFMDEDVSLEGLSLV
jgi:homoserine acetyltransferase